MKTSDLISKKTLRETSLDAQVLDSLQLLNLLDNLALQMKAGSSSSQLLQSLSQLSMDRSQFNNIDDILDFLAKIIRSLGGNETCLQDDIKAIDGYFLAQVAPPCVIESDAVDYIEPNVVIYCPATNKLADSVYVLVTENDDRFIACYRFSTADQLLLFKLRFNGEESKTLRIFGLAATPTIENVNVLGILNVGCEEARLKESKTAIALAYAPTVFLDDYDLMSFQDKDKVVGIKFKKGITEDIMKANNYDLSLFKLLHYIGFEKDETTSFSLDGHCGLQNMKHVHSIYLPMNCETMTADTFDGCRCLWNIVAPKHAIEQIVADGSLKQHCPRAGVFLYEEYDQATMQPANMLSLSEARNGEIRSHTETETKVDDSRQFDYKLNFSSEDKYYCAPIMSRTVTTYEVYKKWEYTDDSDWWPTGIRNESEWTDTGKVRCHMYGHDPIPGYSLDLPANIENGKWTDLDEDLYDMYDSLTRDGGALINPLQTIRLGLNVGQVGLDIADNIVGTVVNSIFSLTPWPSPW